MGRSLLFPHLCSLGPCAQSFLPSGGPCSEHCLGGSRREDCFQSLTNHHSLLWIRGPLSKTDSPACLYWSPLPAKSMLGVIKKNNTPVYRFRITDLEVIRGESPSSKFIDENMEVQRCNVTCPRPCSSPDRYQNHIQTPSTTTKLEFTLKKGL